MSTMLRISAPSESEAWRALGVGPPRDQENDDG
jgi:hypothetical protein